MSDSSSDAMVVIKRWSSAASWAIEAQHGAAANFCLMFALCLQRPSFAHARYVEHVRSRVWQVTTTYGTLTQKVALFDDDVIELLLKVIGGTEGLDAPVYPKTPCRSDYADVWASSFASRRQHRGRKNFAAFVADHGLGNLRSAMGVYKTGLQAFWGVFFIREVDSKALLASQLGRQRAPPWSPPVEAHNGSQHGELFICDGQIKFIRHIS